MPKESLVKATLQLPCSVVILSAQAERRQGAMTATATFVSQVPPLLVVSVAKTFATAQLIEQSREFAVNVIADNQVDLSRKFGSVHGYEVDKFRKFGIAEEPASVIGAPLISGCFANMECKVKSALWEVDGNHMVCVAEVVAFKVNKKLKPMVWLDSKYFSLGAQCQI